MIGPSGIALTCASIATIGFISSGLQTSHAFAVVIAFAVSPALAGRHTTVVMAG